MVEEEIIHHHHFEIGNYVALRAVRHTGQTFAVEIRLGSCRDATGTVLTGGTGASVKFLLAMASHEFRRANARVIGHLIDTRAVILADVGQTIIPVDFAPFTCPTQRTQKSRGQSSLESHNVKNQ